LISNSILLESAKGCNQVHMKFIKKTQLGRRKRLKKSINSRQ